MADTPKPIRGAEIFSVLKSRIIRWEYPPGHRFTEEEICKEFHVSRSPVRETLRMLEEHGLVDKVPYRGCTVKQPDIKEINELYEVRLIFELAVVEQLAAHGMAEQEWQRLARTWQRLAQVDACGRVEGADLAQEDRSFHEALAWATGNKTLHDLLQSINERLHFIRMTDITTVERLRETCRQHIDILDRIAARDAAGAKAAMQVNIEGARQHVRSAIKEALARAYMADYVER